MTFRKIFITVILLFSVILILFQVWVYSTADRVIALQQNELIEYTTEKIEENILSKQKTLTRIRSYINSDMYDFFTDSAEIENGNSMSLSLSDKLEETRWLFLDSIYYSAFSADNSYKFSTDLTNTEFAEIEKCYTRFKENIQGGAPYSYDFFVLDSYGYNDLYICILSDIYKTTYEDIGSKYLATYVICCKISLNELTLLEQQFSNIDLALTGYGHTYRLINNNNNKNNRVVQSINYKISDTAYSLQGVLYRDAALQSAYQIPKIVLIETIFFLLLFAMIIVLSNIYITVPTEKILEYTKKARIFDKPSALKLKATQEFKTIADYINSMIEENRDLAQEIVRTQQEVYEIEIEKYKSDLTSLENQINPHFLYNTLECVRSIAVINDIEDIENIMVHLSEIMRYSVKANNIVPFRDEITIINMYFDIMKIRFPDIKQITVDADEDTLDVPVPKMTLQPIAENIFKHALSASNKDLAITITAKIVENELIITIKDTGRGIPQEELTTIQDALLNNTQAEQNGIGILNVDRRIKIHFGEKYGIKIASKENEYTIVAIVIPKK